MAVAVPVISASAIEVRSSAEIRAQYEERKLEVKAEMEATRLEMKAEVRANSTTSTSTQIRVGFQKEIAMRQAKNTVRVMTATVERLMVIIERIESRIEKIKAAGGDTSVAESEIVEAKANLIKAEANITLLEEIDLTGETAQANFKLVREAAVKVKVNIRAAHTDLMLAVRALGGSRTGVNATSTATTTDDED